MAYIIWYVPAMASGQVQACNSAPKFTENSVEIVENQCTCCVKLIEELSKTREELESMKEILKIITKERNTSDVEIRPTDAIDTEQNGGIWWTQNTRTGRKKTLGQQVTKEDEIKGIPVIINRFALPSEYIPDAKETKTGSTKQKTVIPSRNQRRKVLILGDSHSRGYAENLKTSLKKYSVCGIVKPNATSGEILKSNIAEVTNNDTVVICAGTNDIGKNCADEGLWNIVNFVEKNSHTNIVVRTRNSS